MTFDFFLLAISVEDEGAVPVVERSNRIELAKGQTFAFEWSELTLRLCNAVLS